MKKFFSFICLMCLTLVSTFAGTAYKPDAEYTSLAQLDGVAFAIVNTTDGNALFGTNNQNLGYDSYANAFKSTNSGYLWKAVKDADVDAYYLQLVTPTGANYNCWGMGGVLNSQGEPQGWACSFILGTSDKKGQDIANGALYVLEYTTSGWTIKNVGTDMYQPYSAGAANSTDATYWTFCSLQEYEDGVEPETFEMPESAKALIEAGTQFYLKSGEEYIYGTDQQGLAIGSWDDVEKNATNGEMFILTENEDGSGLLRMVKADGSNISAWGANPCYLNSQPSANGVIFKMGKDQDCTNGSSWIIAEAEGGYTLQNVANKAYLVGCGLGAEPAVWEFYVEDLSLLLEELNTVYDAASALVGEEMSESAADDLDEALKAADDVDETKKSSIQSAIDGLTDAINAAEASIAAYEAYGDVEDAADDIDFEGAKNTVGGYDKSVQDEYLPQITLLEEELETVLEEAEAERDDCTIVNKKEDILAAIEEISDKLDQLLKDAADAQAAIPVEGTPLTAEMFYQWSSADADAEQVGPGYGAYELNKATGLPYGDGNVSEDRYADLTDYSALVLTVTDGTPRLLFNTHGTENPKQYLEIKSADSEYVTSVENGVWTIDLAKIKEDNDYVHLNCIKGANWANVTITSMQLIEAEPAPEVPALVATPAEDEELESLSEIKLALEDGSMLMASGNDGADITLYDAASKTVVATWTAEMLTAIEPEFDEEYNPIGITLSLTQPVATSGTYTLTVPAGAFYCGDNMDENEEATFSWTVVAPAEPLTIVGELELDENNEGKITFSGDVAFVPEGTESIEANVVDEDGNVVATATLTYDDEDWNVVDVEIDGTGVKTGTYKLVIPEGVIVDNDTQAPFEGAELEITVTEENAPTVDEILGEGEVTFDENYVYVTFSGEGMFDYENLSMICEDLTITKKDGTVYYGEPAEAFVDVNCKMIVKMPLKYMLEKETYTSYVYNPNDVVTVSIIAPELRTNNGTDAIEKVADAEDIVIKNVPVATGINGIAANGNATIYNLGGVQLNKTVKGINVINGKKVVVKK